MTISELVLVAIGLSVVVVAAALVPTLIEARRAARSLDRALGSVADRLPEVLGRVDGVLTQGERLVEETRARLDRVERATARLRGPLARLVGTMAGFKEAAETLARHRTERRGGS